MPLSNDLMNLLETCLKESPVSMPTYHRRTRAKWQRK